MASDTRDSVLDAQIASLPIYQLATGINGTANTIISAYEHIEVQHSSTFQNVNFTNQNGFVLTFAKLYALNYLQAGRKILIVANGVGGTGMGGPSGAGPAVSVVNAMPKNAAGTLLSGNVINMNWTPTSLGGTNGNTAGNYSYPLNGGGTRSITVGDGVNTFNLYSTALQRLQTVLGATVSVDTTDGGITVSNNNKVVAMLWHQGETDAYETGIPIANYKVGLEGLIDGFRAVAGSTVPFIVGNFTNSNITGGNSSLLTPYVNYFKTFGTASPPKSYTGFADSQLPTVAPDGGTHFSCQGYRIMGQRYFKAYISALTNTPTPALLTGTLAASTPTVANYNSASNTYTITLSGYTATNASTYLVYYGISTPPTTAVTITGTPSTNSLTVTVTASVLPQGQNVYFKLVVYNPANTAPYPSLTTASTINVPQPPAPIISGFSYSNAIASSVTLKLTSAQYYATSLDYVFFTSTGGGTNYGNCTIAQFLAGFSLSGTWSTSTSTTIYATLVSSWPGLQSSNSLSVTFTAVSNAISFTTAPYITNLTTNSLTINWVINNGTIPSGTTYTITSTPSAGVTIPTPSGNPTTTNVSGLTSGTSYTFNITASAATYTSGSASVVQAVGVAPTANLDIQLLFGSASLPTTVDSISTNPSQTITYNNTGTAVTSGGFSVYTDATRGKVLAGGYTYASPVLGSYAKLPGYNMPLNHTVMCWFYLIALPNGSHIISCGPGSFTHYIYFASGVSSLQFYTNGVTYNATAPTGYGGTYVGKWTHIARTYDSTSRVMMVYINGAAVNGSGTTGGNTTADTNNVNIAGFINGGNGASNNNNAFNGYLDNIRIYSSVLTSTQISDIYNYENTNPTA